MTESNFSVLKSINTGLFDVVHSAEHLFSNQQYHYIPTALRVFTEGVLQDILTISPVDKISIYEMGNILRSRFPYQDLVMNAVYMLRKEGNNASHFKPEKLNKRELLNLFKKAHYLQEFYLHKHSNLADSIPPFLEKNFPSPLEGKASDPTLQNLKFELKDNKNLLSAIKDLESNTLQLKQKLASYEGDAKSIAKSLLVEKQQKIKLKREVDKLKQEHIEASKKIQLTTEDNRNYKENLLNLNKELLDSESLVNVLSIENNFLSKKIDDTNQSQKTKMIERDDLIEKANAEIKKTQIKEQINQVKKNTISSAQIDKKQQQMIDISDGKHFLTAPPGSGKTMILTKRLEKALEKYNDNDIICLTFTTRAAKDMQDRSLHLFTNENRSPFIGNFHTLCIKLHREDKSQPSKSRFASILNDEYREEFYHLAVNSIKNKSNTLSPPPLAYQRLVQQLNNEFNSTEALNFKSRLDHYLFLSPKLYPYLYLFELTSDPDTCDFTSVHIKDKLHNAIIACAKSLGTESSNTINYLEGADILWQLFIAFKTLKLNANSIDYDDILCLGLLQLNNGNHHRAFIQIDEAQDLNPIQWRIITKLSQPTSHIFAVGDTDQSIYSFLGSNYHDLSTATSQFQTHSLVNNFRSNKEIVVLLNKYRHVCWNMPDMVAKNEEPCSHSTMLLRYPTSTEEYRGTQQAIHSILKDKNRKVGLLLPTNKRVDTFCTFFDSENIPYFRVSSSDLMQQSIVQDWFSLIRMHKGTANRMDWYNIVYRLSQHSAQVTGVTRQHAIHFVNKLYEQHVSISDISEVSHNRFDYRLKTLVNAWENNSVVIFDTETTGLSFDHAKIVQLAAVRVSNGQVIDVFDKYIDIGIGLTNNGTELDNAFDDSAKIHKITRETINNGESSHAVFAAFFEFIGEDPLIAHNMNFDNTMLRMGVFDGNQTDATLKDRFIEITSRSQFDTLLLARSLLPNEATYKLADLLKNNNLEGINSHNALDDVKATASLMQLLIDKIKPTLIKTDEIIDELSNISEPLQRNIMEVNLFFKRFYASGEKLKLADILEEWLDFAHEQDGWYEYQDESQKNAMTKDIKTKLISWLTSNKYEGHIQDIFNEMSPKYQQLFTLKESDLIQEKDRLVISTIHRSKGLEFETVLLPEATNNQYPGWRPPETSKAELDAHKKEQKRLLYVALSRPKNKLIVSYHLKNSNGYPTNICTDIQSCYDAFTWKNY